MYVASCLHTAPIFSNPQTQAFCTLVQIPNPINSNSYVANDEHHRGTTGGHISGHADKVPEVDACQDELARIQAIAQDRKRKRHAAQSAQNASP